MADAMKLLPCPFCGGDLDAEADDLGGEYVGHVRCGGCDMQGPISDWKYDDIEEAKAAGVERWNRHASPPAREEAPADPYGPLDNSELFPVEAPAEGAGEPMSEREVRQWIDACNHEPGRQVLRDYLALRARTSEPEAGDEAEHWRERALSAEASMLTLRRIEDAKVFCEIETSDIWSVHVRGPDETVAANSYADAVSYCDKLNAECPDARAVPILSPHKGNPVVLSAYDVACYEYPAAMDAPLRDAFARGAMYASPALRNRTSEPEAGAVAYCNTEHLTRIKREAQLQGEASSVMFGYPCGAYRTPLYLHPAPATADKLREAAGLLNDCIWLDTDTGDYRVEHDGSVEKARAILAALNEQPQ